MATQMSRVSKELDELREKHLAKNQRDKLKDGTFIYLGGRPRQ